MQNLPRSYVPVLKVDYPEDDAGHEAKSKSN